VTARTALSPATLAKSRTHARDLGGDSRSRSPGAGSASNRHGRYGSDARRQHAISYAVSAAVAPEDKQPFVLANSVTSDYLKVTGIPLAGDASITDQDRKGSESVAVIDDVMAQQAFRGRTPSASTSGSGSALTPSQSSASWAMCANGGLAPTTRPRYARSSTIPSPRSGRAAAALVRAHVDCRPGGHRAAKRRRAVAPRGNAAFPTIKFLYDVHTMEQLAKDTIATQRFLLLLFGIFAGIALLLACIGIYGVLAYLTGQRVPEIGVRMALGATAGEVTRMVLRQSLGMILRRSRGGHARRHRGRALASAHSRGHAVHGAIHFHHYDSHLGCCPRCWPALYQPAAPDRIDPIRALRQE